MLKLTRAVRTMFALLLLVPMLAACGGPLPPLATANPAAPPVYTFGPGDKMRITVFGETQITGEYNVGPAGTIDLPLIGSVTARGETAASLTAAITRRFANGYINDPHVSIDVLSYRPFYITGEVNRPGAYPVTDALNAEQAVALAGGFTYRANEGRVFIRRGADGVEKTYLLHGTTPVWILPGDTIRVGERYF